MKQNFWWGLKDIGGGDGCLILLHVGVGGSRPTKRRQREGVAAAVQPFMVPHVQAFQMFDQWSGGVVYLFGGLLSLVFKRFLRN